MTHLYVKSSPWDFGPAILTLVAPGPACPTLPVWLVRGEMGELAGFQVRGRGRGCRHRGGGVVGWLLHLLRLGWGQHLLH